MVVCIVFALMAAAGADTPPPEGLEQILLGAVPGISLDDFLKAHPRTFRVTPEASQEANAPEAETFSLEEQFDRDPFLKLWCIANYGFKEGRLYEFTILWYDTEKRIDARLEQLLGACLRRHGGAYQREVMRVNPGGRYERHAPLLIWDLGAHRAFVARTPEKDPAKAGRAALNYAVFPKDDPYLREHLVGAGLAPLDIAEIHRELDAALKKILGSAAWDKDVSAANTPQESAEE